MHETLLPYYQRELEHLREGASEFGRRYPRVASRLLFSGGESLDPSVERLLEGVAFIAARVHRRVDDSFPELTETLLDTLAPQLLQPVPARFIAQARYAPDSGPPSAPIHLEAGTPLETFPIPLDSSGDSIACSFRTTRPFTVLPLNVRDARCQPLGVSPVAEAAVSCAYVLSVDIAGPDGAPPSAMALDGLSFFLGGDAGLTAATYDFLFRACAGVAIGPTKTGRFHVLDPSAIEAEGFDDAMADAPNKKKTHVGHRILRNYFSFPQQFSFVRVSIPDHVMKDMEAEFSVHFLLNELRDLDIAPLVNVSSLDIFHLNCVPVINLFQMKAEPIALNAASLEYRIEPDIRRPSVYQVQHVDGGQILLRGAQLVRRSIAPLFGAHVGPDDGPTPQWVMRRTPGFDGAVDAMIRVVMTEGDREQIEAGTLMLDLTCSNRNLPLRASLTQTFGELRGVGVEALQFRSKTPPLRPIVPPIGDESLWRLISHLSLNHLSLLDGDGEPLRDMLRLYASLGAGLEAGLALEHNRHIGALTKIERTQVQEIMGEGSKVAYIRGLEVKLSVDQDRLHAGSLVLFGGMLERFLSSYASVNSFTRSILCDSKDGHALKHWPARPGRRPTL